MDRRSEIETRELVDALLSASRALVAVAVRSLNACDEEITLAQFRVLALLCSDGPYRVADLAEALGVSPPNATRICDRLAQKGLMRRSRSTKDRRSVRVSVTQDGRAVVEQISAVRREELGRIVRHMPFEDRDRVVEALRVFSVAAGEVPEDGWAVIEVMSHIAGPARMEV